MIWKRIAVKVSSLTPVGEDVTLAREQASPILTKPADELTEGDLKVLVILHRTEYDFDEQSARPQGLHLQTFERDLGLAKAAPLCAGEDFV